MAYEVKRQRLNYMNACVKYYDDGSEILQSYSTDVVKKTPDGKYVRLWAGWSPSTMKQVKTWCGHYFRGLPFADGTYENLKRESERRGYDINGRAISRPISEWKSRILSRICAAIDTKDLTLLMYNYNSACMKELKFTYKNDGKVMRLLNALKICSTKTMNNYCKDLSMAAKLYDYDFNKLWINGGLSEEYKDWICRGNLDTFTMS